MSSLLNHQCVYLSREIIYLIYVQASFIRLHQSLDKTSRANTYRSASVQKDVVQLGVEFYKNECF